MTPCTFRSHISGSIHQCCKAIMLIVTTPSHQCQKNCYVQSCQPICLAHILKQYILTHMGVNFFVSENQIRNLIQPSLAPAISAFFYNNDEYHYWYLPIDLLIEYYVMQLF